MSRLEQVKRIRLADHGARMEKKRNARRNSAGTPEGKRTVGRPRRRWENDNKMDLREIWCSGIMDRINLAQDMDQWRALVNTAMNLLDS
jgi:hypothetical protein